MAFWSNGYSKLCKLELLKIMCVFEYLETVIELKFKFVLSQSNLPLNIRNFKGIKFNWIAFFR